MSQFGSVLAAAFGLPVGDRMCLIDALASSVPDDCPLPLSPEWLDEIDRRSTELESGALSSLPWEQVQSELLRKVYLNRAD